jgi:O-acetyl-ADP-ribose deacetylase (regulator of RNase III)
MKAVLGDTTKLGGCNTGDARITPGFKLKAEYVILEVYEEALKAYFKHQHKKRLM